MKVLRIPLSAVFALATAALSAQTDVVGVLKIQEMFTMDGSTTTPNAGGPYSFEAFVSRASFTGGETVTATTPAPSTGLITFAYEGDGSFGYSQNFTGDSATAKTNLDAEFANGDYAFVVNGPAITLTLGNAGADIYPGVPLFTLGNGSFTPFWSGGILFVDPSQSLTITSSTFSTNFLSGSSVVGVYVEGGSNNLNFETNTFGDMTQTSTFLTVPAGNFLAGQTYSGNVEFIRLTEVDTTTISGVMGIAGFSVITAFSIQAVPEPSTYAAILGALAFAGVVIQRRRSRLG